MNLWPINLQKKEAEIDNGENIVSSISGAGKSRKLHIREWNYNISSHHIQK